MISASRGAANRLTVIATTLLALAIALCCAATPTIAANVGGTPAGGNTPSATVPTGSGAHVTSVRITSVSCTPAPRCSANPHQVSIHGTLLLKGIGLAPGMVLGFPQSAGARVTARSPGSRLRKTSAGLLATVPKAAHSGHVLVLLSHGRYTSSYGPDLHLQPRAAPAGTEGHTAGRGGRSGGGGSAGRPGDVDLVRQRLQRRLGRRRFSPRPTPRESPPSTSRARTARATTGASSRRRWSPNSTRAA